MTTPLHDDPVPHPTPFGGAPQFDSESQPHWIRNGPNTVHWFDGRLLGFGSARMASHVHPPQDGPGQLRCSGCRWTEVRIYWSDTDGCYLVGLMGYSAIPGERIKYRAWWVESAIAALYHCLVDVPERRSSGVYGEKELPTANHAALESASKRDIGIALALTAWEDLVDHCRRTGRPVVPVSPRLSA